MGFRASLPPCLSVYVSVFLLPPLPLPLPHPPSSIPTYRPSGGVGQYDSRGPFVMLKQHRFLRLTFVYTTSKCSGWLMGYDWKGSVHLLFLLFGPCWYCPGPWQLQGQSVLSPFLLPRSPHLPARTSWKLLPRDPVLGGHRNDSREIINTYKMSPGGGSEVSFVF